MENNNPLTHGRVASIDALRGFDMFWIVGGGTIFQSLCKVWDNPFTQTINTQLEHVIWEGFRFEDLIFPLFLFIVGLVIPFSISKRIERGDDKTQLYIHIFKRALLLYIIGMIYNGALSFNMEEMRWTGVLHRMGICYLFASIIVMNTNWKGQAIWTVALLVGYWLISAFIPVPGFGICNFTMEGCLSSWIDQHFLPGTLYYSFGDNEGLISNIPAIATALLGVLAGHWLRSDRAGNKKTRTLLLAGTIFIAIGYGWGTFFPIIKNIWSSSFVLVAGGWSFILLAIFYWIIDVKGFHKWAFFFQVIGANAILIYWSTEFINFQYTANYFLHGFLPMFGKLEPLVLPTGTLAAEWLLLWFLYKKKVFFKI
ncbi:MAG TPA: DUF5009 domain-containing protein [Sedimentisphaerales bacterium]|nr:DUF5009 domain-containing protein [Sedimentisphaerales bacterium]